MDNKRKKIDKLDFIIIIKCYAVKGTNKKVKMDHRMGKTYLISM